MKCYNHQTQDAIGICKICGKALCLECTTVQSTLLTCKGECETSAYELKKIQAASFHTLKHQKRNRFLMPTFFCTMGLLFIVIGITQNPRTIWNGSVFLGLGFFIFGLIFLFRQYAWSKKINLE